MKMKDRMFLGTVSGVIGNIAKEIVAEALIRGGLGKHSGPDMAAGIFLTRPQLLFKKRKNRLLGFITDHAIGATLGVMNTYMLSYTGKDYYLLKGLGSGHLAWASLFGFLSKLGRNARHPMSVEDNFNSFIAHGVYGLVTNLAIVKLGDEGLFQPKPLVLSKPAGPGENPAFSHRYGGEQRNDGRFAERIGRL